MALLRSIFQGVTTVAGAAAFTLAIHMVLPLMQVISKAATADTLLLPVDTALPPPPPPVVEEKQESEPEREREEQLPELTEVAPPLDLAQLEMSLEPSFSGDWASGDFGLKLESAVTESKAVEELFSVADLDQKPRAIYQPAPVLNSKLRQQTPATVNLLFVVDERGRVEDIVVQTSSDKLFEAAALSAVKQWKFEPGQRNGKAVRSRMRVPITFPKER